MFEEGKTIDYYNLSLSYLNAQVLKYQIEKYMMNLVNLETEFNTLLRFLITLICGE